MFKKMFELMIASVVAMFVISGTSAAYAADEPVKEFIVNAGNRTVALLNDSKTSDSQKEVKLADIFFETVDVDWIGRFVIGKNWRTSSEEQKKKYLSAYRDFIISSYVPKFREYTNETFEVKRVRKDNEKEYYVQTQINRHNQTPVLVDYRVRQYGPKQFKVFDIIAEGVSLLATQRSDFTGAIQTDGFDTFLTRLQERTQQLKKNGGKA